MQTLNFVGCRKAIRALFDRYDLDSSETLSYDEFCGGILGLPPKEKVGHGTQYCVGLHTCLWPYTFPQGPHPTCCLFMIIQIHSPCIHLHRIIWNVPCDRPLATPPLTRSKRAFWSAAGGTAFARASLSYAAWTRTAATVWI